MARDRYQLILAAAASFLLATGVVAQTVTFDFDTGTPGLTAGMGVPINQTSGAVLAAFSSPEGSVFSVQSDASTQWHMSQFSGLYMYDNNLNLNRLDILFDHKLTGIAFTFATADFQQVEVPTTIQMTAYDNASGSTVGVATAHGTYAGDTMPMGTLSFSSTPWFDRVEITIAPGQPLGASDFFVDNIVATKAPVSVKTSSWGAIKALYR